MAKVAFNSPAMDNHIPVPADTGGKAAAEIPGLPAKTPSLINPNSICNVLGAPHPATVEGPAKVYTQPVANDPPVHGRAPVKQFNSPAAGTTDKDGPA